jgi:hypothetical protein
VARAEDHIALANRHQEALSALLDDAGEHAEWVTTIAFYKALQIVDACLVTLGVGVPADHGERSRMMKATRQLDNISKHYWVLKNAASIARYLTDVQGREYRRFSDYLRPGEAERQVVKHRLAQIEKSAHKILKLTGLRPAVPPPAQAAQPPATGRS